MKKLLCSIVLMAGCGAAGVQAGAPDSASVPADRPAAPEALSLSEVLDLVRRQNPEVRAAQKTLDAARAAIASARAWPDPMVSVTREKPPEGGRMDHLMLEQDIPFPGKKRTEGAMKRHEASIAEARYRAKVLDALAQARILYYQLYRTDQMIRQLAQNVDILKATLQLVQARLPAGASPSPAGRPGRPETGSSMDMDNNASRTGAARGPAAPAAGVDIFSLMAELGQMENTLFEENQRRTIVEYELNALLDRDLNTPVGPAAAAELVDIPRPLPELLELAEQHDPLYLSSLHEQRHAAAMQRRARLEWAPDFGVLYDRMTDAQGMKGREVGVRATVPLWISRPLGGLKEARAHVDEAAAMAKAMRNEALKMVSMEYTETHTHLVKARAYRDSIVPAAESASRLARRQYESGRGDYLRLLESVRTLISVQTDYYNELYHYGEHWARLEQWVGLPLSSPSQETPHE